MITLPSKTFGKSAKAIVNKLLPTLSSIKRVSGSFVLRDSNGIMLGHIELGSFHNPKAVLVLSRSNQ
jgi:hypothetical protein